MDIQIQEDTRGLSGHMQLGVHGRIDNRDGGSHLRAGHRRRGPLSYRQESRESDHGGFGDRRIGLSVRCSRSNGELQRNRFSGERIFCGGADHSFAGQRYGSGNGDGGDCNQRCDCRIRDQHRRSSESERRGLRGRPDRLHQSAELRDGQLHRGRRHAICR